MGYSITVAAQLLFIFPCIVLSNQCKYQSSRISADKSALLAFRSGIVADPENVLSNWNETTDICEWNGVGCNDNRRVSDLGLKGKSLQGTISPLLSNLSCLELLELSENYLQGPIPKELGTLSRLGLLGLKGNKLCSEIPESFGLLKSLRYIDLSKNQLVGSLPESLFYNCTKLVYVDLSNNLFRGVIPPQIGNHLPYMENLLLYLNQLTGYIPSSLSNSSKMMELDLENNFLMGKLPSDIVVHMPLLEILHLSYNNLHSDDNNRNLTPFFSSISNLTHLEELELAANNLRGELPSAIGLLHTNLSQIHLEENLIDGAIPPSIANLSNLTLLNLSSNLLNGTIPSEISLLQKLERLCLSNNLLHGTIPAPLGALSHMGLLDLSRNQLSGTIPITLANLTQLRKLMLNGNLLSGTIPSSLGKCENLEVLDLSYNRLTGTVPAEVASLSNMAIYFNLSNNLLIGTIPLELTKMDKVWEIDLSSNNFSGKIPPNLEGCEEAELINFSHNSLQGPVPGSLGQLLNLRSLDLSFNFLSGEIPASLQRCSSLVHLNLSFNNFSGPLPTGGLFNSLSADAIKGNPLICGTLPLLKSCNLKKSTALHSRGFLALLVTVVSISAFTLTIGCKVGFKKVKGMVLRRKEDASSWSVASLVSSYPRITYRELWKATRGFHQNGLIGSGSFGHVYKGVLSDGTVVAVKVLQLQTGNSTKSFTRECQVLKRIRHRNLMRIITACSLPDFKALVLPFMTNGSLEDHLYPEGQDSNLTLPERLNICSDIAEGIAYLHHHSPVQVIHCDLKPSNILLNDEMTALVSDFGIARLVVTVGEGNMAVENTSSSTANLLCGSIGYVAPEYGMGKSPSTKGDVYSYGVLVLEMITRRRPTDEMFSGALSLQKWVKRHYQGQLGKVIDPSLTQILQDQNAQIRDMWEVVILELVELGLLCTQDAPSTRPTMVDIADDLDRLKLYLGGDTTTTFTSSLGLSSSTVTSEYW
ncbi:hypothetical protein Taro_036340 [Colocasia esculenta]|uniref:non-specific serine/threonine protein kinase n=1 Tax=Colocasia esculenta TaxID=4460 RepID=A0A843WD33_COLES|nr:hypothetical protein [Colocasia esculenta]